MSSIDAPGVSAPPSRVPSRRNGVDWTIAGPLVMAHALAMLAPFFWSTAGLWFFIVLYLVSGLGVTAGAHRLFTHASFRTPRWMQGVFSCMFHLAGQGSLTRWVRDHHIHHSFSDREGDPHTPNGGSGFWYAQLFWLWKKPPTRQENKWLYEKYAKGMMQIPTVKFFSSGIFLSLYHLVIIVLVYMAGAFLQEGVSAGALAAGWYGGISAVVWGVFLRIVLVLHATSLVNSASHLWGYRRYDTREESRNNALVALVSLGEGWHNNHHGKPSASNQGFHSWWELDFTFCILWLMGVCGLIRDLRVYRRTSHSTEIWFSKSKKHG